MTIQRVNGAAGMQNGARSSRRNAYLIFLESPNATEIRSLPATTENLSQLLGRNNFELGVRTVAWLFIRAPSSKLRCVTEAAALHVVVSDFDYKLRTQRLPRQVLALAPPALSAGPATFSFTICSFVLGPVFPRMRGKRVLAVRCEECYKLPAHLVREAGADADMLQRARVVEKAEQE